MRKTKVLISLLAAMMTVSLASCGQQPQPEEKFGFTLKLQSGSTQIQVGSTDKVVIVTNGVTPEKTPEYEYSVTDETVATVSQSGDVNALSVGVVTFTVLEKNSNVKAKLSGINVVSAYEVANGGFNYAAASGQEAIAKRTEILGALEKYAVDSHLTGITLFENGGYVKYRDRLDIPADEYITGYGFGILSEGDITADLASEDNPAYKRYYHSASSSDPLTINALNASGSQVSDLAGYITSSYWGNKMNEERNGYEWYPVLAKDKVNGKDFNRPIAVYDVENPLHLYNKWRIYVKTGEDGLKYTTLSTANSEFNERGVVIEDYEFIYQLLLTGANKQSRGAEMAGDTTYGIKGAQKFYNRTMSMTDQTQIDQTWNDMKTSGDLGIHTGHDANGYYLELELLNPIDDFTAMYTLSSSLVSPLPRAFFEKIGDGSIIAGVKKYGNFNNGGNNAILDYTLCLGPYTLESWIKKQTTIFKRNESWVERTTYPNRYKIKGVKIVVISGASEDEDAIYKQYNAGLLDACGIPTKHLDDEIGQPGVRQTKGDSTFKLNVNTCDQAEWDRLNKEVWKNPEGDTWELKPWMANDDFVNGLFYSIDRQQFARKRGVQPSINYFSDAYLSDPENGVSYNSTQAHKDAVKAYHTITDGQDNYGYNLAKAVSLFKSAVNTLVKDGKMKKGTQSNPEVINIHIRWMYQSDITEYGEDIKSYFETAFNDPAVSNGTIKLEVLQDAVTNWEDVYNLWLMTGKFDLGFGAISGNTYNPLNFMEVLKSDNSSSFTLNWGTDTSKVDTKHPLVYDNKQWSFDALWEVSDHGGVVENGQKVKPVKHAYCELPTDLSGKTTNELQNGAKITIPLEFVNVPDVSFEVNSVQIYIIGSGNTTLPFVKSADGKSLEVTISQELAQELNNTMREVNKIRDEDPVPDPKPFILGKYNIYWSIEVYYSISIAGGTPSQTYVAVAKNQGEWESK